MVMVEDPTVVPEAIWSYKRQLRANPEEGLSVMDSGLLNPKGPEYLNMRCLGFQCYKSHSCGFVYCLYLDTWTLRVKQKETSESLSAFPL